MTGNSDTRTQTMTRLAKSKPNQKPSSGTTARMGMRLESDGVGVDGVFDPARLAHDDGQHDARASSRWPGPPAPPASSTRGPPGSRRGRRRRGAPGAGPRPAAGAGTAGRRRGACGWPATRARARPPSRRQGRAISAERTPRRGARVIRDGPRRRGAGAHARHLAQRRGDAPGQLRELGPIAELGRAREGERDGDVGDDAARAGRT